MKLSTKKFQLVSKYANYPTWDEKQNAPSYLKNFFEFIRNFNLYSKIFFS